jgi:hypothetical protein
MTKSTKYQEKVPKLEDYKAPWLKEVDGEQVVDVPAALKAIHTLMVDKAKAQDAREDAAADTKIAEEAAAELQAKVDDKNAPDAQAEIARANKKAEDAVRALQVAVGEKTRLEVVVEQELTAKQAKWLPKDGTKEELEAKAAEIKEDFPAEPKVAETDEEREAREEAELEGGLSTAPVVKRLVNPADPNNGSGGAVDYDALAAKIHGQGFSIT